MDHHLRNGVISALLHEYPGNQSSPECYQNMFPSVDDHS